jgi:hypothetical protein
VGEREEFKRERVRDIDGFCTFALWNEDFQLSVTPTPAIACWACEESEVDWEGLSRFADRTRP